MSDFGTEPIEVEKFYRKIMYIIYINFETAYVLDATTILFSSANENICTKTSYVFVHLVFRLLKFVCFSTRYVSLALISVLLCLKLFFIHLFFFNLSIYYIFMIYLIFIFRIPAVIFKRIKMERKKQLWRLWLYKRCFTPHVRQGNLHDKEIMQNFLNTEKN